MKLHLIIVIPLAFVPINICVYTYMIIQKTFSVDITATWRITDLIFACIFPVI